MPREIKLLFTGDEIIRLMKDEAARRLAAQGYTGEFNAQWWRWSSRDLMPIGGVEYPPGMHPMTCDLEVALLEVVKPDAP